MTRILVYGKDARSDAVVAACGRSRHAPEIHYYSDVRTPGLEERCVAGRADGDLSAAGLTSMVHHAGELQPDLVIVGPEEPLAAGLVDALLEMSFPCFGPQRSLARIETSKSWTRRLLDQYAISGNPGYRVFESGDGLADHLRSQEEFVIKPDGLTGGKGVRVFPEHFGSMDEAVLYAEALADQPCVVIEERLDGEEFSLMSMTDGESFIHCPVVQDHKRAYAGDRGPNTGGMGSYSCADHSLPFLTAQEVREAQATNEAVVRALYDKTGQRYRGVLYGGFIATAEGIRVIEYNARFGDPEAVNVLPILETDFVDIAMGAASGNLPAAVSFAPQATVCKYLVPATYPDGGGKGDEIVVPRHLRDVENVRLYWAATELSAGHHSIWDAGAHATMTGSRALAVVGLGATVADGERIAEAAATEIDEASRGAVRHRSDIGSAALLAKRQAHMSEIRRRR